MQTAIQALVEPRRREILQLIRDRELSAGAIASGFDVSRPAISQHLGVLKEAGLVSERREGTRRFYRARPEAEAVGSAHYCLIPKHRPAVPQMMTRPARRPIPAVPLPARAPVV